MKYILEFFTPFLIAGIVIAIIAGRQSRKDNKVIRDFNREKDIRDEY
jgi:hypothetical protein